MKILMILYINIITLIKNLINKWSMVNGIIHLFKLYMKCYNQTEIYCHSNQLTSIPSYPNLKELFCADNRLTSLPNYPKLERLFFNRIN
jgi:Leucine-rich repeat (LRR) protein